jgi:serine/threonine-protein kinase
MDGLIARGGMGEVYRAHDTRHDRVVAVKLLGEDVAGDHAFRERFKREAQAAARLREPHVIPIHAYGEIEGRLYLDMRLVEGQNLGELISERGPMAPADAIDVVSQVAGALDAAHAERLVHRDVKPSNVIVTPSGFSYLVDFGIARTISANPDVTATGDTIGTLHYMAPERFGPAPIDHRVDVYSLACVLYQCLTGLKPFRPENPLAVMYAHLNHEPPRPSAYRPDLAAFDHVIARGMAKDPAERFASAGDLARAARDATSKPSSTARLPVPELPPPATPGRPRSRRWALAGAALVVLLGLTGFLLYQDYRSKKDQEADPTDEPSRPAADLGIDTPISKPACDGRYIVIVGSAVAKDRYVADVERFLEDNPGANYLHALTTGCGSLRTHYDDGTEIYAAYYGPFSSEGEACERKAQTGNGAFVRTLDNTTPPQQVVACG